MSDFFFWLFFNPIWVSPIGIWGAIWLGWAVRGAWDRRPRKRES